MFLMEVIRHFWIITCKEKCVAPIYPTICDRETKAITMVDILNI